jgi:hypothetical protein
MLERKQHTASNATLKGGVWHRATPHMFFKECRRRPLVYANNVFKINITINKKTKLSPTLHLNYRKTNLK